MNLVRWVGGASLLAACAATSGAHRDTTHHVRMAGFQIIPAELHVARGDTVIWGNGDIVPHTATSDAPLFDSGAINPDSSWRTVFTKVGRYDYHCEYHPNMKAVVVVK